ncbi:MAG: hypothetical protein EAZ55_07895 [Cytophagales bacterium]|nr:MAG: hypothetical protein EAZ55_07895 [Cytophagales bacterium]
MAWDLTIYGIDWQKMQANTSLKTSDEVFVWLDMHYKTYQKHFTETEASVFFREFFHLRSKNICFAINQLVSLLKENFALVLWEKMLLDDDSCYILTKEQITEVLIFLKTFAQMLGNETVAENRYVAFIQQEIAHTWYKNPENEFAYFADYAGIFEDWEAKIQRSDALYFYWENSF